jgi:CubicO group peptidase (beta-lactamase class C family)
MEKLMRLRQIGLLKPAFMIIVLSLVFSTMGAQAQEMEIPIPQTLKGLEQRVKAIMTENDTPGVGIALVSRDEILWVAGFGTADIATEKAVDTDTLFRIGSISKSFVSLAVLQLQEQGKLSLNDTLRELAPEIAFTNPWEDSDPVRLVHLLEHTTGFEDIHLREFAYNHPTIALHDVLAYNPASRTSRWPPGRHMSYSNSGPVAAAYVVEKIAGQPFEEFVRQNLFEPLAMETADFFLTTATCLNHWQWKPLTFF